MFLFISLMVYCINIRGMWFFLLSDVSCDLVIFFLFTLGLMKQSDLSSHCIVWSLACLVVCLLVCGHRFQLLTPDGSQDWFQTLNGSFFFFPLSFSFLFLFFFSSFFLLNDTTYAWRSTLLNERNKGNNWNMEEPQGSLSWSECGNCS